MNPAVIFGEIVAVAPRPAKKRGSWREIQVGPKGKGRKRSLSGSSTSSGEGGYPEHVRTIHKDVATIRERYPGAVL